MSDLLALLDWRILATIAAAAGVYFLFMREAPKQASKASTGSVFSQAEGTLPSSPRADSLFTA